MAYKKSKNKGSRRGSNGIKVPVAVVAGFLPGIIKVWEAWPQGASAAAREAGRVYLGTDFWDAKFNWQWLWYGTLPIIAGALVHRFVGGAMGVNRALGRAGIPFIRL
jgi:hypothetical protein